VYDDSVEERMTTKSGPATFVKPRFEPQGLSVDDMTLEQFEAEIMLVGAGIGGGFNHTSELIPMKYNEAMSSKDSEQWKKAVEEEHQRMVDHKVKKKDVPQGTKVLSSTWAMKKKSNGKFRARINARGFEQSLESIIKSMISVRQSYTRHRYS
jgi:galactokinase/mevalonate kinase-like predicted kinase